MQQSGADDIISYHLAPTLDLRIIYAHRVDVAHARKLYLVCLVRYTLGIVLLKMLCHVHPCGTLKAREKSIQELLLNNVGLGLGLGISS